MTSILRTRKASIFMGKIELPDQDVRAVIIKIFQEARANTLKKMEA